MKKYIYILAALSMVSQVSYAQSLESDVDAELDQMYSGQPAAAQAMPTQQVSPGPQVSGAQPIYILNQAPAQVQQQSLPQVQKQPTTLIEASPLTESRAEQIRKARQDAELQTEQKIVEKLEVSRMEDEKKRAAVLFGDKFNQLQEGQAPQQQPQQVVQPVVVQPVVTQQVTEPQDNTRDIVREEIAAAMKVEEEANLAPLETKYVSGIVGIGEYPDVKYIKGNYALGVAFGTKYDNIVVEGAFVYSQYSFDGQYQPYGYGYSTGYNYKMDVNQYSGSLAAKVQLFSGIIKPVFGGLVSYSYRSYEWSDEMGVNYANADSDISSHAVDVGTIVGADLEFSPKYSLGLDFKYMWNLSNRVNNNNYGFAPNIEKLQYYVMSLVGRVNF